MAYANDTIGTFIIKVTSIMSSPFFLQLAGKFSSLLHFDINFVGKLKKTGMTFSLVMYGGTPLFPQPITKGG